MRELGLGEYDLLIERAHARVQLAHIVLRAARELHIELCVFG